LKIQARQRGKRDRQRVEELKQEKNRHELGGCNDESISPDACNAEDAATEGLDDLEQSVAALKIQARHRGKQARQEVEALKQERKEQTAAATKIQAVHRGKKSRRELGRNGDDPANAGNEEDATLEEITDPEQEAAALRIQAIHRGKHARQEVEALKQEREEQTAAATKIQAVHRGKKTRREIAADNDEPLNDEEGDEVKGEGQEEIHHAKLDEALHGELDDAIAAVQQAIDMPADDWIGALADALKELSEESEHLRCVLDEHGWRGSQFEEPPVLQRLLDDLLGARQEQQGQTRQELEASTAEPTSGEAD